MNHIDLHDKYVLLEDGTTEDLWWDFGDGSREPKDCYIDKDGNYYFVHKIRSKIIATGNTPNEMIALAEKMEKRYDICTDDRFEVIEHFKRELIEATNIETSPKEMEVIDNILFRFWQLGWLEKLKDNMHKEDETLHMDNTLHEPEKITNFYNVTRSPEPLVLWVCSDIYAEEYCPLKKLVKDPSIIECIKNDNHCPKCMLEWLKQPVSVKKDRERIENEDLRNM